MYFTITLNLEVGLKKQENFSKKSRKFSQLDMWQPCLRTNLSTKLFKIINYLLKEAVTIINR